MILLPIANIAQAIPSRLQIILDWSELQIQSRDVKKVSKTVLIEPSKFNKLSRRLDIRLIADRLRYKTIIQKRTLTKSHSFQFGTRWTPDHHWLSNSYNAISVITDNLGTLITG